MEVTKKTWSYNGIKELKYFINTIVKNISKNELY